jgi:two-component system NtrC family sensor kinase
MPSAKDENAWRMENASLRSETLRLNKIIDALADRAECTETVSQSDFGVFQSTIILEDQVRSRTSELLQAEEHLKRNLAELAAANRRLVALGNQLAEAEKQAAVGQLAGGVAHEINNPLGFINSNLSSLERYHKQIFGLINAYEEAEPLLPPDIKKRLSTLRESIDLPYLKEDIQNLIGESRTGAERIRLIVLHLKDYSRSLDEPVESVDLHKLIDDAITIVWDELKPALKLTKEYGQLPSVVCMPVQTGRAIGNLLRNALQSMPDSGQLSLHTACTIDQVTIAIKDNGCGIDPEIIKRIFDPFFTTRPVGQGTGLGLSVAQGIISQHGGRIEIASELGKGSCFTIHLPVKYCQPV